MAKDKEKEVTPKFNFEGTIAHSKYRVVGVPVLTSDRKAEKTLEEVLDEAEKAEVQSARKEDMLSKLKKKSEPNPKRYTVDPETGKIDIDEEGGEYTQKDAMMVSASIKGKSGQYDAAIALINAAKTLVPDNQPNVADKPKPKEFYVEPETGIIIHDAENGEYTLSEARTISQSLQKGKQAANAPPGQKGFLEKLEEITDGLVTKKIAGLLGGDNPATPTDPVDEVLRRLDQIDQFKQRFGNPPGGGTQALAQSGIRGELLKLMLEDERERLKMGYEHETQVERNKHLGTLAKTVKENLGDGIAAIRAAAEEARKESKGTGAPAAQPQGYKCGECGTVFAIPNVPYERVGCPKCKHEYTKAEVEAA